MNHTKTLSERIEKMHDLRAKGYNCAQAVAMVFDDVTGIGSDSVARLCGSLGAGVTCGEICGAVLATSLVNAARFPDNPAEKATVYADSREIINQFKENHNGCIRCADLKGKQGVPSCNELIEEAITLTHNHIFGKE